MWGLGVEELVLLVEPVFLKVGVVVLEDLVVPAEEVTDDELDGVLALVVADALVEVQRHAHREVLHRPRFYLLHPLQHARLLPCSPRPARTALLSLLRCLPLVVLQQLQQVELFGHRGLREDADD